MTAGEFPQAGAGLAYQRVAVTAVQPGDWITEIGTPEGPWYLVLHVDEQSMTLDGRADPQDDELAVSLRKDPSGVVLRRSVS